MKFNNIKTERLLIRKLTEKDSSCMSLYRSLTEVAEFQSWEKFSEKEALKLIKEMASSDPSVAGKWFQFGIEHLVDDCLIGDVGFMNSDSDGKSWVGFTLDSKYWRQGLASEAVAKIISYYQSFDISEVWASIDPKNISSQKLLGRLEFSLMDSQSDNLIFMKKLI